MNSARNRTPWPTRCSWQMMATLEENHKIKIPCLCCLCFSFGNVRVSITTDKTAYVRGEDILINVTVTNRSLSKLTYIKASLVQVKESFKFSARYAFAGWIYLHFEMYIECILFFKVITCVYSNRPGPITYNEIAKLHRADDFNGTSDLVWSNAVLKIPDDAPNSRLGGGCNIIRMDYKVMVSKFVSDIFFWKFIQLFYLHLSCCANFKTNCFCV